MFLLIAFVSGCSRGSSSATTGGADGAAAVASATSGSPASQQLSGGLTVFAAASLSDAFNQMGAEFARANPHLKVVFNFAASSLLRTQLEQGAKADIFASADQPQMDAAVKSGVVEGRPVLFAKNRLVVIYPAGNPGKINAIQDLARPGLKLVLTDPNVPIGAYAREALAKLSADPAFGPEFGPNVLANLRSQETNVRAVVSKVQLGEADAAIAYVSDVTPAAARDVRSIPIPDRDNVIAGYPIALTRSATNAAAARAFIDFARSAHGQAVLARNGFLVDADTSASR